MATLAVWQFDTADGAGRAALALNRASRSDDVAIQHAIQDAALVEWAGDERKPRTRHLACGLTSDPLDDGFWGLLFGLVFFVPLLGAAMGAATGALAGALADVGIDDHFINRVRDQVAPGTSALFLLIPDPAVDQVHAIVKGGVQSEAISTVLGTHQEAAVRSVFAD